VSKERRLGRGLEALLGRRARPEPTTESQVETQEPQDAISDEVVQEQVTGDVYPDTPVPAPAAEQANMPGKVRELDISLIDANPYQPRQDFGEKELAGLSESIAAHGLIQPIVVRPSDDGRYELIAGERRLRATRKAGLTEVTVMLIEADDRATAELALIENIQRKDLNPLEKAESFQSYLQAHGCTQEELAERLSLDRSTISNLIRLLELPDEIQHSIRTERITQGHARALLPLGEVGDQIDFCRRIERERMSVRATEAAVAEAIATRDEETLKLVGADGTPKEKTKPAGAEHLAALEQEIRAALGMKVKLVAGAKGKGRLTINFGSHEDFDRLRQILTGRGESESMTG